LVRGRLSDLGGILGGQFGSDPLSESDPSLGGPPGGISLSIRLGISILLIRNSFGSLSFENGFSVSFQIIPKGPLVHNRVNLFLRRIDRFVRN